MKFELITIEFTKILVLSIGYTTPESVDKISFKCRNAINLNINFNINKYEV